MNKNIQTCDFIIPAIDEEEVGILAKTADLRWKIIRYFSNSYLNLGKPENNNKYLQKWFLYWNGEHKQEITDIACLKIDEITDIGTLICCVEYKNGQVDDLVISWKNVIDFVARKAICWEKDRHGRIEGSDQTNPLSSSLMLEIDKSSGMIKIIPGKYEPQEIMELSPNFALELAKILKHYGETKELKTFDEIND